MLCSEHTRKGLVLIPAPLRISFGRSVFTRIPEAVGVFYIYSGPTSVQLFGKRGVRSSDSLFVISEAAYSWIERDGKIKTRTASLALKLQLLSKHLGAVCS